MTIHNQAMTHPTILTVKNLKKVFGKTIAVDTINFSVKQGICFGLLGPNGAGKTTTIEMIEGILPPTQGAIYYKEHLDKKAFKNETGIQFQNTVLQDFLTVYENLKLFQSFYPSTYPLDDLIELCSLKEYLNKDTRRISGGQKQRLLLALALLNQPKFLILDEPTVGLDPQARRKFWSLIENIKKSNTTILLTTHYMEEADLLCDEIVIIDKGKIIVQGCPKQLLRQKYQHQTINIPKTALKQDVNLEEVVIHENNGMLQIQTDNLDETLKLLLSKEVSLIDMQIQKPNLEDLFLDLTGHHLRD